MLRNLWKALRPTSIVPQSKPRGRSNRRLVCEPLERRELLAGVTLEGALTFPTANALFQMGAMIHDSQGNAYLAGAMNVNASAEPFSIDLDPANPAADDPAFLEFQADDSIYAVGFIAKYDAAGQFQWVQTARTTGVLSITELELGDSSNDVYFAGDYYGGSLQVGSINLPVATGRDRFVGRLDAGGNVQWALADHRGWHDYTTGLAVDEARGRLYLGGHEHPGLGSHSGMVVAVSISSAVPSVAWTAPLVLIIKTNTNAIQEAKVRDIAVAPDGAIYAAGTLAGTADFDPSSNQTLSISSTSDKGGRFSTIPGAAFVWKLTTTGSLGWAKVFAGSQSNSSGGHQIAVDSFGSILVGGSFRGTIDFDPSTAKLNLTSNGVYDAFLVKLTSAGALSYARRHGGPGSDGVSAMTLDAAGNIYLVGSTFLAKFNNNGTLLWSQNLVAAGTVSFPVLFSDISVSPAGKIHAFGSYQGTLNADDDSDAELDNSLGNSRDLFWLTYDEM